MLNDSTNSGEISQFNFNIGPSAHSQPSALASALIHGVDQSVAAEGLAKIKDATEIFK